MEIKFADSFFDSLKVLKRQQTWWYKTYDLFVYRIPYFFKNIYRFRKELWSHRWWDYRFTLEMFRRSLEIQEEEMRLKGWEERVSLDKKLEKMRRVIQIIKNIENEGWMERAEEILGKQGSWTLEPYDFFSERSDEQKEVDTEIIKLAKKIQQEEWKEFCAIIQGPDYENFDYEKYDGSDLRSWWD